MSTTISDDTEINLQQQFEQTGVLPNCDILLDSYLQCVNSKNGLTHVDDCPNEAELYKQCIDVERKAGETFKQRYDRDATFSDRFIDNCKDMLGMKTTTNPYSKHFVPPKQKTLDDVDL